LRWERGVLEHSGSQPANCARASWLRPRHAGCPDQRSKGSKRNRVLFLYFGMLRRVRPYGRGFEPHGGCTIVKAIQISKARATNKTGVPFARQHVVGLEACIEWRCVCALCVRVCFSCLAVERTLL